MDDFMDVHLHNNLLNAKPEPESDGFLMASWWLRNHIARPRSISMPEAEISRAMRCDGSPPIRIVWNTGEIHREQMKSMVHHMNSMSCFTWIQGIRHWFSPVRRYIRCYIRQLRTSEESRELIDKDQMRKAGGTWNSIIRPRFWNIGNIYWEYILYIYNMIWYDMI
jgi:hypothetical protein